jgi:hypothetical protein
MFGGGGAPSPARVEPQPRPEDPEVQKVLAESIRRRKLARGFRNTILSEDLIRPTGAGGGERQQTFGA